MQLQLIRNATMKITYAGQTLLTDPMLSPVGAFRSFAGIAPNPTVGLIMTAGEILDGVDAALVSHLHPDHFDDAAAAILAKDLPIYCQPGDDSHLRRQGFTRVTAVAASCRWQDITLTRTGGHHGSGKILERLGTVSGFVLMATGEPTVYWVGDSIWCDEVAEAVATYHPQIIITHSGGAILSGSAPIIMDAGQTLTTLEAAPEAVVIAVHMESLDHCTVSRADLQASAHGAGVNPARLLIPEDGAILKL